MEGGEGRGCGKRRGGGRDEGEREREGDRQTDTERGHQEESVCTLAFAGPGKCVQASGMHSHGWRTGSATDLGSSPTPARGGGVRHW